MGPGRKNGGESIRVDDDFDCRLYRRMKRRSIANKSSSRDVCVMEDNVAATAVPGTGELIAIDDDEDNNYKTYLDLKALGVPGYVDHGDGRYDDVDNNNVDRSSGYVARDYGFGDSGCADNGNDEAGSDISTDPEYKVFLDNARMEGFMTVFCIGNVVIRYNSSEDDGESSSQEKTYDFRTVNTEAKRISKGFQKRGRMSTVGNGNIAVNTVHPTDNHCLATSRSKSKVMGSNKQENKCDMKLDNSDPDYDLFLTSMAVDAAYEERMTRHSKKVRCSNDEKNQSDAEATILKSNKQENNCGVKLGDSVVKCNLNLRSMAVNWRNEENMTNHCNKVRFGKDEKNESDAEVVILELDPSSGGQCTPFVSSKAFVDECSIPNLGRKFTSEYREELIELLKKPYAEEEFLKLMKELLRQKPVERDMDLRSGPKPFKTKIMGKSYLDLHKDLRLKIREAGSDQLKVLNILRGFFFWLQNISREGAFQPWMDPSIMNTTTSHS